jgi:hypothetical protein
MNENLHGWPYFLFPLWNSGLMTCPDQHPRRGRGAIHATHVVGALGSCSPLGDIPSRDLYILSFRERIGIRTLSAKIGIPLLSQRDGTLEDLAVARTPDRVLTIILHVFIIISERISSTISISFFTRGSMIFSRSRTLSLARWFSWRDCIWLTSKRRSFHAEGSRRLLICSLGSVCLLRILDEWVWCCIVRLKERTLLTTMWEWGTRTHLERVSMRSKRSFVALQSFVHKRVS